MTSTRLSAFAAPFLSLLLLSSVSLSGQELQRVEVVNFPDLQSVSGKVEISGPTPHSRLVSRHDVVVSPGSLDVPGDAVALGTVDAAGFTDLVLSFHGLSTDRILNPGEVIVTLLPDEPPFVKAFEEDGLRLLAIESRARIEPAPTPHFVGQQVSAPLGFPRYRVYLNNTSDRSVTIDFYAYLTH